MLPPGEFSLNNHEKARRELWSAMYVAAWNKQAGEPYCGVSADERARVQADTALRAFDVRFQPPGPR